MGSSGDEWFAAGEAAKRQVGATPPHQAMS